MCYPLLILIFSYKYKFSVMESKKSPMTAPYKAPAIELIEIETESGYALSSGNNENLGEDNGQW